MWTPLFSRSSIPALILWRALSKCARYFAALCFVSLMVSGSPSESLLHAQGPTAFDQTSRFFSPSFSTGLLRSSEIIQQTAVPVVLGTDRRLESPPVSLSKTGIIPNISNAAGTSFLQQLTTTKPVGDLSVPSPMMFTGLKSLWAEPVTKVGFLDSANRALVGLWVSSGDIVDAVVPISAAVGRDGTFTEERSGERLGGIGGAARCVKREGSVVAGFQLERGPYFGRTELIRLRVLWKKLTPNGLNPVVWEDSEVFGTGNFGEVREQRRIMVQPGEWISGLTASVSMHTSGELFLNDIVDLRGSSSEAVAWSGSKGEENLSGPSPVPFSPVGEPPVDVPFVNGLKNGDFEEGRSPLEGESVEVLYPGDESTGWRIENGSVDHVSTFWISASGKRSLDLNGWQPGTISQTFVTEPGRTYLVAFNLSGNPNAAPSVKRLAVWAGASRQYGAVYEFDTSQTANTLNNMRWGSRLFKFVASEAKTTLVFSSVTPGNAGPALDSVRILNDGETSLSLLGPDYSMYQPEGAPTERFAVAMRELTEGGSPTGGGQPPSLPMADGLSNGDFELSRGIVDGGAFVTLYPSDDSTGWRVENGSVDYILGHWNAASGERSLDMNGFEPGTISQTVSTEPGKIYRLLFKLSANPDGGPALRHLAVWAGETALTNGQVYVFNAASADHTAGDMRWQSRIFKFEARGTETKICFSSLTPGPFGPALDSVRIVGEGDAFLPPFGPDYAISDSNGERWFQVPMCYELDGPLLGVDPVLNPEVLVPPVILPPVIEQQPVSAKVLTNGWVNLRVQVSSSTDPSGGDLIYQWLKDGVVLEGETGSELRRRATANSAGVYQVEVTNEGGSVKSDVVTVEVLPPAQLKGVYQGLLVEGLEGSVSEGLIVDGAMVVGRVTVTMTGQTAFSGKLDYAGVTYRFKGELDEKWMFEKTLTAKGKPPVDLAITLDDSGDGLRVSAHGGQLGEDFSACVNLKRFGLNAALSPAVVGGRFTGSLSGETEDSMCWGYLTASLSKVGMVNVSGRSADGAPVVASGYLQADGSVALYCELFGALHPYPGQLCGSMSVVDSASSGRVTGEFFEINFAKPEPRGLVTQPDSIQAVRLTGSVYEAPVGMKPVLNLGEGAPVLDLWVAENGGDDSFSQVRIGPGNKFEELDPKPLRFRVKLETSTGVVSGRYSDPESGLSWRVFGVVLQADNTVFGFWYGNGQSGSWNLVPVEGSETLQ